MRSDEEIKNAVHREIREKAQNSPYSKIEQLILACRALADQGHWSNGIAGQITARGDTPGTYYTLKFGVGADEATHENFILTDDDLRAVDGQSMANPGARFHLWVYRSHPHVQCIVHTHPPAVSALSMIGQPLSAACMDGTPFFENCGHLAEWPGLPIADEEGWIISQALGSKKRCAGAPWHVDGRSDHCRSHDAGDLDGADGSGPASRGSGGNDSAHPRGPGPGVARFSAEAGDHGDDVPVFCAPDPAGSSGLPEKGVIVRVRFGISWVG